jgi:hypothetical protein
MQSGRNIYDAYVNDSDLIGTHFRYGKVVPISDMIADDGKDLTLPTLDLEDFISLSFTTGPDGKIYQLPSQQFANLYWLRQYASPEAQGMTFSESGPCQHKVRLPNKYFGASMNVPRLPVVNEDGTPKWRMAPSPKGSYWEEGMKLGLPIKTLKFQSYKLMFYLLLSYSLNRLITRIDLKSLAKRIDSTLT